MSLDFSPFDKYIEKHGISLVEAFLERDFKTDFEQWQHDRLCLVRRGEIGFQLADHTVELGEQELIYLPAGISQRWVTGSETSASLFMICFDKNFFSQPPALGELMETFSTEFPQLEKFTPIHTSYLSSIRWLLNSLIEEKRGKAPDKVVFALSLLTSLLIQLLRGHRELVAQNALPDETIAIIKSIKYFEKNIFDKISVSDMANIAGMPYRRYTDAFKKYAGKTANEFMKEKRVELAKQLLLETGDILHASLDAGFDDLANFYRVFKKTTGITPKKYIAQNAANTR